MVNMNMSITHAGNKPAHSRYTGNADNSSKDKPSVHSPDRRIARLRRRPADIPTGATADARRRPLDMRPTEVVLTDLRGVGGQQQQQQQHHHHHHHLGLGLGLGQRRRRFVLDPRRLCAGFLHPSCGLSIVCGFL